MQKYQDAVIRSDGKPAAGATITVTLTASGAAATIYSGNGTGAYASNVVTADASGEYSFYAANGRYNLAIAATGYTSETKTDVVLFDLADATAAGLAFTQSGTGAVTRTVQAKEREVVSVTDFTGADATGATSSSAAFTSAGSVATTVEVHIPAGTWNLATSPAPTGAVTWVAHAGAAFTGAGALPGKVVQWGSALGALAIRNNKTVATSLGEAPGIKVGIADGTEAGWTNNPVAADFVVVYPYISTSAVRNRVWAMNPIVDIISGFPATAWCYEGNINNGNANAPDPRNTNHNIGVDMVSGGTYAPSAAYATSGTSAGNRWKHGIWFDYVGGQSGSTLIKTNTNVSVDFGIDMSTATINYQGLRIGNTPAAQVAAAGFRQLANGGVGIFLQRFTDTAPTGNVFQLVNAANSVVLSSIDASGNFLCGTITSGNITSPLISNGAGVLAIGDNSGEIQIKKALVALGGGAAPTLGTIGGSGPAAAAQNSWVRFLDSAGAVFWIPAWK